MFRGSMGEENGCGKVGSKKLEGTQHVYKNQVTSRRSRGNTIARTWEQWKGWWAAFILPVHVAASGE